MLRGRLGVTKQLLYSFIEDLKLLGQVLILKLGEEGSQQVLGKLPGFRSLGVVVALDAVIDKVSQEALHANAIFFALGSVFTRIDKTHDAQTLIFLSKTESVGSKLLV